jgi:lycopene cyclase domain-containing protein
MTYGSFLGLFLVIPIALTLALFRVSRAVKLLPVFWPALGVLLVVVYVATSPWDNAAVAWGLWGFDPERIWGIRIVHLPLEEYLFFGLQTVLTGLWVGRRLSRLAARSESTRSEASVQREPDHGVDERLAAASPTEPTGVAR